MIPRAVAHLLVVTGSPHGDVLPALVTRYLDGVLMAAETLGVRLAVLHGGAVGVDAQAGAWALGHDVEMQQCNADRATYGILADELRNRELLDVATNAETAGWSVRIVAFPGARDGASWDMIKLGRGAGIRTDIVINNSDASAE